MDSALTTAEREALERLRASLYDWHFCDLKKAASPEVDLPRLAFIGLASWIDTVARLYNGRQDDGFSAWRAFIREYLPESMHSEREVRRLYDGLRNAISHEYGTRDVLLSHAKPFLHWTVVADDIRFLDLHALLDEFESAFEKFYADLETKPDLRARVLPHAQGLLAPVAVEVPVASTPRLDPAAIAASASATAPAVQHIKPVPEPLDFEEWLDLLRRRIGDADAIKSGEAHDFRELMADYANVTPPQWYHEAFDELQVWGHLDPAYCKAAGTAHGRLSADGRAYLRDEAAED